MIGTRQELERRIGQAGRVGSGAALDPALLDDLLGAASSRLQEEIPDRTLEPWPALDEDGADTADPVAIVKPAGGKMVRVPDLRELVELRLLTDADDPDDGLAGTLLDGAEGGLGFIRYRRPSHRSDWPAIWLELPQAARYGYSAVRVVGRFGPAESSTLEPKDSVRNAALTWAARAFHARAARFSDTSQDPAGGVLSYFRQVPADVMATINALAIPGA